MDERKMIDKIIKIAIAAMICTALISGVACVSIAYQNIVIAREYFDYEYQPSINNTNTISK